MYKSTVKYMDCNSNIFSVQIIDIFTVGYHSVDKTDAGVSVVVYLAAMYERLKCRHYSDTTAGVTWGKYVIFW